jgi:hypothetical protein
MCAIVDDNGWFEWNLTDIVRKWHASDWSNDGFRLWSNDGYAGFYSRECDWPEFRPVLYVEWSHPVYTLAVIVVGQGDVDLDPPGGTYTSGTLVTLTANADIDWYFDHWEGNLSGSDNPETIMMDGDKSVTAVFKPECFGDLDYDGQVDLVDLVQLLASYGLTNSATYEQGDLDGDGDVDLADLTALLGVYGTICW